MQHKPDRTQAFKGVANKSVGVDLMIFDILENLPVPNMSNLPSSIHDWNQMHKDLFVSVFDFAGGHVHDDGVLLLFLPDDLKLKATLQGYMEAYHFSVYQEWMGVNRLRLTSARDVTMTVSYTNPSSFFRIYCIFTCFHFSC
jgi:hypothetical protein